MNNEEKILEMLGGLTDAVSNIRVELKDIKQNQSKTQGDITSIKTQVTENTHILKSLEHKSDEHKALLDQLNHRSSNIEGEVKSIKEDLTHVEIMTGKNMESLLFKVYDTITEFVL